MKKTFFLTMCQLLGEGRLSKQGSSTEGIGDGNGVGWSHCILYLLRIKQNYPRIISLELLSKMPGRIAQSVGHLTRKSEVLGSIPCLVTYFCFSFRLFKRGICLLLAKVCARSTG